MRAHFEPRQCRVLLRIIAVRGWRYGAARFPAGVAAALQGHSIARVQRLHFRDVVLGFAIRRHATVPGHCADAGVVRRGGEGQVASIAAQQSMQVAGTGINRLRRRERIGHTVFARRLGHQLHHALRTLGRHRLRIEPAFYVGNRTQPCIVDAMLPCRATELRGVAIYLRPADLSQARMCAFDRRRGDREEQDHLRTGQLARAVHRLAVLLALVQGAVRVRPKGSAASPRCRRCVLQRSASRVRGR